MLSPDELRVGLKALTPAERFVAISASVVDDPAQQLTSVVNIVSLLNAFADYIPSGSRTIVGCLLLDLVRRLDPDLLDRGAIQ